MNYKAFNKDATMDDYVTEMNRQVEYEEFLSILRTATVEEGNSPLFQHKMRPNDRKRDKKVEDYITTQAFYDQAKSMYEGATQDKLVNGKYFTLGDALDDTIDMWHYGRTMFGGVLPLQNSYIPVKHTIMPKPNLVDN